MRIILTGICFLITCVAIAQKQLGNYVFKVQTGEDYIPLTGAKNISSKLVWDEERFKFPIGFSVDIDGKTTSDFSFHAWPGIGPASDTSGLLSGFFAFSAADLVDRGYISGLPSSPLRYIVSGVVPNRIFKFECYNAAFYQEVKNYGTLNDYVDFQIWIYETTNIVELRFGQSQISHLGDYFYFGNSPLFGFAKNLDMNDGKIAKGYFLSGSASAPSIDSFYDITVETLPVLTSFPNYGNVYRFIPKAAAASIGETSIAGQFKVYPTYTTDNITVVATNNAATTARIIDQNGKLVSIIENIQKGANSIDVSYFASGNYVLEMANAEGKAIYKFTKQ